MRELKVPYSVECFSSGEGLLKRLGDKYSFDLIYLDIKLEGLSGIDIGKRLREQFHNTRTLLIYISACEEMVRELFECMTFRFLSKPIDPVKFQDI